MVPGAVRRWWRAATRAGRGEIVYHPDYGTELAIAEHDHRRATRILTFLLAERIAQRRIVHEPHAATLGSLRRVHSDDYLESLEEPAALVPIVGFSTTAEQRDTYVEMHKLAVGGTLVATRLAAASEAVAVHLGGGFHHALPDRGQGFCVFNDVAVAVAEERARGFESPILVIDLDLHDGDGTRDIFRHDATVHTFSIHNHDLGSAEAESSTSVALGPGITDERYLDAVRQYLVPVLEEVRPELVFFLAGTDPAADDRLGNWKITDRGMLQRDRFVISTVRASGARTPIVVLLAGGYGASSWRYSARFFSWLLSGGEVIEPPRTEELTLARYRKLARSLRAEERAAEGGDDWRLTEDDVLGSLPGHSRSVRLLDRYSRHGIELMLERYGLLDRFRALGFDRLHLELDLDDQAGQTIRIFGAPDRDEPILELRVRRDGSTIPGMVLLRVEWLLLQNPRARFTRERARLPGQRHPGLGLLKDVVALLIVLCERLSLDGMVFTPSHYHLAAQSRRRLRFLDPRDEALFRSMRAALGSLSLGEAAQAVEAGRIVDAANGQAVGWRPAPMVLPVSDRLKARLHSREYEARVEALARSRPLRLG